MERNSLIFDCTSGISGDMAVAAMIDLGADRDALIKTLDSIPAEGFSVKISQVKKSCIACCDFDVILEHENHDHDMQYLFGNSSGHEIHNDGESEHHQAHQAPHTHEHHEAQEQHSHGHHHEHRGLTEINSIIDRTEMTDQANALAKKIFLILAQAESKAHGIPTEQVHFHEVGAIDSIVDVIALAVTYTSLNPQKVYVKNLCEGQGTIRSQHGLLSIPVPAVANIAASYKLELSFIPDHGEFITPTGAAFLAAIQPSFVLPQKFTVLGTGLGAGKREYTRPSMLRIFSVREETSDGDGIIWKLESNIDDSTGEQLGYVMEKLFQAGAYDVHYIPCMMKKNRPGYVLNVVCSREKIAELEAIIFADTTTIGIRRMAYERSVLERKLRQVETSLGTVDVKEVILPDGTRRTYPEYKSVAALCKEKRLAYYDMYSMILCELRNS